MLGIVCEYTHMIGIEIISHKSRIAVTDRKESRRMELRSVSEVSLMVFEIFLKIKLFILR
jgi:hypothetical protein